MELNKSEVLKVRVRSAFRAELEQAAYAQEMRLSEFIRYALSQYLAKENGTDESD